MLSQYRVAGNTEALGFLASCVQMSRPRLLNAKGQTNFPYFNLGKIDFVVIEVL
jgi:hypothetical protein